MGFETTPINLTKYGEKYAYRRYGLPHTVNNNMDITNMLINGWSTLVSGMYTLDTPQNQGSAVTEFPNFGYGGLGYDAMIIQKAWKEFINTGDTLKGVVKFEYDLVDITRQAMSDIFTLRYNNFSDSYNKGNITETQNYADIMIDIINDMNSILLTNKYWMLGTWIEMARNQTNITSDNNDTKNWYEFNARNQITLWGPNGQINN